MGNTEPPNDYQLQRPGDLRRYTILGAEKETGDCINLDNAQLYYYYTDDLTNKVKVTEIFEIDEEEKLAVDPKLFEGIVEDHPNPHQHHHNVVSEWNGVESAFYIDEYATNQMPFERDIKRKTSISTDTGY
nr:uncharacterized protein LOC106624883 [Bactrocera oleae]